jgi:YegS/Rv2252/BmrU family lipid kinase
MRKAAAIIVNPVSGRGRVLGHAQLARIMLEQAGLEVSVLETLYPGHGRRLARQNAPRFQVLVSVGGDGTLNEVVNGVVDAASATPVAIIPTGTANVVSRELGLPRDLPSQVKLAASSALRHLDLGFVGRRRFIMCAGAGFDGAVVHAMAHKRKGRGITMLSYVPIVLGASLRCRLAGMRVIVDGATVQKDAVFTLVGNLARYGGIFRIFKDANPQDGLLDICCFRKLSIAALARYAWAAHRQRLHAMRGPSYYRGRNITLETDERILLQVDGDPHGELPATFGVLPSAVAFCVPPAAAARTP